MQQATDGKSSVKLSARAIEEIRSVIKRRGQPHELRSVLREFCEAAHAENVPPERLLVALKTEISRFPEVRRQDDEEIMAFVSDLVSACIEEFYQQPRAIAK